MFSLKIRTVNRTNCQSRSILRNKPNWLIKNLRVIEFTLYLKVNYGIEQSSIVNCSCFICSGCL